ncbi:MAG: GtrA family protein [Deltaproteobacteria bacterium]
MERTNRRRAALSWVLRYMLVGGVVLAIDVGTMVGAVELAHARRVPSVAFGAVLGASVGFALNRRFVFRNRRPEVGRQATLYALSYLLELGCHTGLVAALIHGAGLHYVIAKAVGDVVAFNGLHLVLMRLVVFTPLPGLPDPTTPSSA